MKTITLLLALGLFCQFTNPHTENPSNTLTLKLNHADQNDAVKQFITQLKQHGLSLKKQSFSRSMGKIKRFKLQLTHPNGLDWKIKGQGFETFEIQLQIDDTQQVQGLSYRFNEKGNFSKPLSLAACGNSTYQFKRKHSASTSFIEQ